MNSEMIVFLFCAFVTGGGAVKYQDEANTISEEERRAATPEIGAKAGLRPSETKTFHKFYFPSGHESGGIGSSGSGTYGHNTDPGTYGYNTGSGTYGHNTGPGAYGHSTGYPNVGPQYYIPSAPTFHPGQHPYSEIGEGHGNGGYGGPDYGGGYGFIHGSGGNEGIGHSISTGHKEGSHKALALKAILIPLAGIALLGAAAALSTNPVLLQLGVLNGRRRRRSLRGVYPTNPNVKPARPSHF